MWQRDSGVIIDNVTSQAMDGFVKLNPFYPLREGHTAASVEGIWQRLKEFVQEVVDLSIYANITMKQIKPAV